MAQQLSLFDPPPAAEHPRGEHPPAPKRPQQPRRRRALHPRAAAHALALQHLDLADTIAGNFARRTIHPFEDLRQVAIIGLLKAAERFNPTGPLCQER